MYALDESRGLYPSDWYEYAQKYKVDPNSQDGEGKTVLHHMLRYDTWDLQKVQK